MILCIDIGNTNIKYGVFDGEKLVASFRVASKRSSTADEYGVIVRDLLESAAIKRDQIEGIIMSSVIPQLNYTMEHMCEYYFGKKPLVVGPGLRTGINVRVDNPREVGADRIVNSVAAYKLYGGKKPIICIDFGTATTFNVITEKGELIGGVIAPGIKGSLDSLVNGTAKLPNIELELPGKVICKDTITNMQAGLLYGFAGLVDGILKRARKELGVDKKGCVVVATGGLGSIIAEESDIDITDRTLTLVGLRMLYEMNTDPRFEEEEKAKAAREFERKLCEVMRVAIKSGGLSISLIQRKTAVGYAAASKLFDEVLKRGYIAAEKNEMPCKFVPTMDEKAFEEQFGEKL